MSPEAKNYRLDVLRQAIEATHLPSLIEKLCPGANLAGLSSQHGGCILDPRPGHEEHNASFSVSLVDGVWLWHRFGTEDKGNAFDFLVSMGWAKGKAAEELKRGAGLLEPSYRPTTRSSAKVAAPKAAPRVDPILMEHQRATADHRKLTEAELEKVNRQVRLAPEMTATAKARLELERRGLWGHVGPGLALNAGWLVNDYGGPGKKLALRGALMVDVRGPDGETFAVKLRNIGTQAELEAAKVSRYCYLAKGHGSPAWCSPNYGKAPAVLWREGELNGAVCFIALQRAGQTVDVQGLAGSETWPHLPDGKDVKAGEQLAGRDVWIQADHDAAGSSLAERLVRLAYAAGAKSVRVLPPLEDGDPCDMAGRDGLETLGVHLVGLMEATAPTPKPEPPPELDEDEAAFWLVTDPTGEEVNLVLPQGFSEKHGGIYFAAKPKVGKDGEKEEEEPRLVAPRLLAVVGLGEDVDTGQNIAIVRYQATKGQTRERRVPLEALADGRDLVKALAPFDAPVLAPRGRDLTVYLDALRTENRQVLPYTDYSARLGLRAGGIVGPGYTVGNAPTYGGAFGTRFRKGEDAQAYPLALGEALSWGAAAWPLWLDLGLAALGPLLPLLKAPRNPVVWHYGPSNAGKTTAARFAGGLHLDPTSEPFTLQATKQTTPKGTLQTLEQMGGYPALIDEAHMAYPDAIEAVVYNFANGSSYTRGGRDGTPRETPSLHGVVFLAGEAQPEMRNLGSRNRALMVDVRKHAPLGALEVPERAELLEAAWTTGAGLLGPVVLKAMWADRERFLKAVKAGERTATANLGPGEGREWARVLVAAEIALAYLLDEAGLAGRDVPNVTAPALEALSETRAINNPAALAMNALVSLLETADGEVTRDEDGSGLDRSRRRLYGSTFAKMDGGNWLVVTSHKAVKEALETWGGGQAVEKFGMEWARRGWVEPGSRKTTTQRRFDGAVVQCLVLTPAALEGDGESQ